MIINVRKLGVLVNCFWARNHRLAMTAIAQFLAHNNDFPPALTVEFVKDNNVVHKFILVENSEPYPLY